MSSVDNLLCKYIIIKVFGAMIALNNVLLKVDLGWTLPMNWCIKTMCIYKAEHIICV